MTLWEIADILYYTGHHEAYDELKRLINALPLEFMIDFNKGMKPI